MVHLPRKLPDDSKPFPGLVKMCKEARRSAEIRSIIELDAASVAREKANKTSKMTRSGNLDRNQQIQKIQSRSRSIPRRASKSLSPSRVSVDWLR